MRYECLVLAGMLCGSVDAQPTLSIAGSGTSLVLRWSTNTSGFNLTQSGFAVLPWQVSFWGDSLTQYGGTGGPYGNLTTNFLPRIIPEVNGYTGEGSYYILAQFLAAPAQWNNPTLIWAGRNDGLNTPDDTNITITNISAMMACLPNSNDAIVLGILTSSDDEPAWIETISNLDTYLSNTYAPRYLDVHALLDAHGDGSAQDNSDIANGYTPSSLRADSLHLNLDGYTLVASNASLLLSNLVYFQPVPTPVVNGSNYEVTLPVTANAAFYRLRAP